MDNCTVGVLVDITASPRLNRTPKKALKEKCVQNEEDKENALADLPSPTQMKAEMQKQLQEKVAKGSADSEYDGIDELVKKDLKLLDDEEFDFDLLQSPSSSQGSDTQEDDNEDEEVFFGPVSYKETLVAASVDTDEVTSGVKPLSPLAPEQMVELFKEAQTIACEIRRDKKDGHVRKNTGNLAKSLAKMRLEKKSSSSSSDQNDEDVVKGAKFRDEINDSPSASPLRRQFTFTVNKSPLNMLPPEKRESLPIVDEHGIVRFSAEKKKPEEGSVKMPRRTGLPKSRLATKMKEKVENKVEKKYSPPKRLRTNNTGCDESLETCSVMSDTSDTSSVGSAIGGKKRTLAQPKIRPSLGLTRPTGLKKPDHHRTESASSSSSIGSQESASIPTAKPSGIKAPLSKLSLIKSGLQRRTLVGQNRPGSGSEAQRTGPMKAMQPVKAQPMKATKPVIGMKKGVSPTASSTRPKSVSTPKRASVSTTPGRGSVQANKSQLCRPSSASSAHTTPVKPDRNVQPKRLMNGPGMTTPTKSRDSSSSVASTNPGTPLSTTKSASKRRSFLPTPTRLSASSRLSSANSSLLQSPASVRTGSVSSVFSRSSTSSVEPSSPATNKENKPVKGRKSLLQTPRAGKAGTNYNNFAESSPSCLKPRKPLVQHTPLKGKLTEKKASIWSPIRKPKALTKEDEAIQCTKRTISR